MIKKPFALSLSKRERGSISSSRTASFYCALAIDEVLGFRPDFIEHQLAHAVRDPNGRAYNRTSHLPERHKMMQAWADYLDSLKVGAVVLAFPKAG